MLVSHRIDHDAKVIITIFAPEEVSLDMFFDAFKNYQEELKYLPDYHDYHELVDFRPITNLNITPSELKEFSSMTMAADRGEFITRLALLVDSRPAFTLAKLYEMLRNLTPGSKKQVRVFRDMDEAYAWLKQEPARRVHQPAG